MIGSTAAQAASGELKTVAIKVLYDGEKVPNAVDADSANGIVATLDKVAFQWDLTAADLQEGEFTQTLPEGWAWDAASLGALDTNGSQYQASYTLSPDQRTLTAKVTVGTGGATTLLSLTGLKAVPGRGVANGSAYTPEISATDGSRTLTAQADAVEVRGESRINILKSVSGNNIVGTHDFGDGSGTVAAHAIDYHMRVQAPNANTVGVLDVALQQPAVWQDSFTVSAPYSALDFQAQIVHSGTGSPTLVQSGNDLAITLDGYPAAAPATGEIYVRVRLWVRDADLTEGETVRVVNTAAPQDWRTTNGDAVATNLSSVTAEGSVTLTSGITDPTASTNTVQKQIWAQRDPSADPSIACEMGRSSGCNGYSQVSGGAVASGSTVVARLWITPGTWQSDGSSSRTMTDIAVYDFWDPSQQRIIEGADLWVGISGTSTAVPSTSYTVHYTSGGDRSDPESNVWVDSIAAAGGAGAVTGIRVAYTPDDWGTTADRTGTFAVNIPLKVVADQGTTAIDHGVFRFTDATGVARGTERSQSVRITDTVLNLTKVVNKTSVVGGDTLVYTLTPTASNPAGGTTGTTPINDLKVVDQLPAGFVSVDTSAVDPAWRVTREGSAETGLILTFEYVGSARIGEVLPEIVYSAATSVFAPSGTTYRNTATLSADGAASVTRQASSSYIRAQVVAAEKVVTGDERIQPNETASYETRWYNFQSTTQGESYVVDVLPFNGDGRGTSFTGASQLLSATLTDGRGGAAPTGYATLQYTTAPAASVLAAEANDDTLGWQDASGVDLSTVSGITALRVVIADFVVDEAGIGGLEVELSGSGWRNGDALVNTSKVWLGVNGSLGSTNPAGVEVQSASITGLVWNDLNGDGARDAGEPVIPGATVTLQNGDGTVVTTGTSGADGSYAFSELLAGGYRVTLDPSTLAFPASSVVSNTYDLSGTLQSDSGVFALAAGEQKAAVDFGYVEARSSIHLSKSGRLSGEAKPGEQVEWSFTIENTGEAALTDIDIEDHLAGVENLRITWPGAEGVLQHGERAAATAFSTLTGDQVDAGSVTNTATVSGTNAAGTAVTADAEATVALPEGASLLLEKTGRLVGDAVAGGEVEWSFTVTNSGNVTLSGLDIDDPLEGIGEIEWGAWPGIEGTLKSGESVTATASYRLTQDDVDAESVTNTAVADGDYQTLDRGVANIASNEATAVLGLQPVSSLSLVKTTNDTHYDTAPGAELTVGDAVTWKYEVTNTGATTLEDVGVNDDREGAVSAPSGFDGTLAPGESITFEMSGMATEGGYHNVGTATAKTEVGAGVAASDESWYTASASITGSDKLSITGGHTLTWVSIIGMLLLGLGAVLLMRRRQMR